MNRRYYLRPSVHLFAERMERALRANDKERGRRGWKNDSDEALFARLQEEVHELEIALTAGADTKEKRAAIRKEAADVGNFAMMLGEKRVVEC